jgi:hypothetical protein
MSGINIGNHYHLQDDTTFCGAAVAQMILQHIENGTVEGQRDLATENWRNGNKLPGASIEALVKTLNSHAKHKPFSGTFVSEDSISDPLSFAADALNRSGQGVAALVASGRHWVALNGVASSSAGPTGLYVHDPHPTGSTPPVVHAINDTCGTGQTLGIANSLWTPPGMGAFHHFSPIALVYVDGNGSAEPSPNMPLEAKAAPPPPAEHAEQFEPLEMAAQGIHAAGIVEYGPLSTILTGFRATSAVTIDHYWHVTLEVEARVIGYALIARRDGKLLAVMASGNERPLMNLSAEALLPELEANKEAIRLADPDFMRAVDAQPGDVTASFFWRPCREAPSPSHPLVRISIGTKLLYRDHFGAFHARLQLLDR